MSVLLLVVMLLLASVGEPARILGLFPFQAKSHFRVMSPLLEELSNRGHQMTVISAFPRGALLKNYKEITIPNEMEKLGVGVDPFRLTDVNKVFFFIYIQRIAIEICEKFYTYPEIQELINSDEEYDLILYEPFLRECTYGLLYRFKAPSIQISSNTVSSWMGEGVGNPHIFSYMPDLFSGLTDHMTFPERLYNAVFQTFTVLLREWYVVPRMETIMRKHFQGPSVPGIRELEANASFLLLNSHVAFNYPRPLTPNTAEVGGMHIKEARKLPQDLQEYLDDAPQGVIYFSLGSTIPSAKMPEEMRKTFVKAFSQMKQKVLWKWEMDSLPEQPSNVHIGKWFPQTDILAHPNVKVFITHSGLLSTQEATYFGVPLITLPIARDQHTNAKFTENAGYAIVVNIRNLTTGSLVWALNEVLSKPSYAENARIYSRIFKDQPQKPLTRAVFWVEYVLRHKGAPHMKSAALSLNFFQLYLLDIIASLIVAIPVIILVFLLLTSLLYYCCFLVLAACVKVLSQYVFPKPRKSKRTKKE